MNTKFSNLILSTFLFATTLLLTGCDNDDPAPVNEEEVITTVEVTLTPATGNVVTLRYFDADGDAGSTQPVITGGTLVANLMYTGTITLLNETESPAEDVTEEIEEEDEDHLFCFEITSANLEVSYADQDDQGLGIGLRTSWMAGAPSQGSVTVTLLHQPGTKNGDCSGGDTDIEVTFPITIQ